MAVDRRKRKRKRRQRNSFTSLLFSKYDRSEVKGDGIGGRCSDRFSDRATSLPELGVNFTIFGL